MTGDGKAHLMSWKLEDGNEPPKPPRDYSVEDEHPGLVKVKQMWERGEFDKLDKMVKLWTALENLGMLGGLIKRFLIWAGIIAGTWLTASGWLTEYIRSIR
jgi:hypothetical protein